MADMMDARFDIREMYGEDSIEEARRKLSERTYVNVRDEGVIEVAVEAGDPVLARDMTAACIAFTDSILMELGVQNAESKIEYLERSLAAAERRREEADSVMSRFMESAGVFEIESQAKAAFQIIGALTARMSLLEVERDMMRMTRRPDWPDLERLDLEIEKLKEEIRRISEDQDATKLFPPLSEMPGLATRYLGMTAERMALEFTLAFIRLKLEDARISSRSTVSAIRVIDAPFVAERRTWPKRKQIVIILTLATVLWTCFVILVREKMSSRGDQTGERA
jgi:capsule polysaccharide export protein KpsE/RkpR